MAFQECEMCGDKHRCKYGLCKECDKSLDNLIITAYRTLQFAGLFLPYYIGIRVVRGDIVVLDRKDNNML